MVKETYTFSSTPHFGSQEAQGISQPEQYHVQPHYNNVVSYYHPEGVGNYHYGERHPMKPARLTLTHALVNGYGLNKKMDYFFNPRAATQDELEMYHDHDYIEFLKRVQPEKPESEDVLKDHNFGEDCPVFEGLYDFVSKYAGASLHGARRLTQGTTDIAINWSGGLHHAKRNEASGFCYINDCAVAILEMLRYYPRVMYIDIDIHHGDGVELAFWNTDRVMTVSFHKYTGDFFPGTGKLDDNGGGPGKHFCLNVPLLDGIDDESYLTLFKSIMEPAITSYQPSAIVLQCGADSLGCDRLGAFNLSIHAHSECVRFIKNFSLPLLVLGGGGYTIRNVSRCWTNETGVLLGMTLDPSLPSTPFDNFFAPDHALYPKLDGKVVNQNTRASLEKIRISIREKLRYLNGAPSVQMQEIPPDLAGWLNSEERNAEEQDEEMNGTGGAGEIRSDPHRSRKEYFDSELDVDGGVSESPAPPPTTTRARGRGRGRARGRGRGSTTATATREDGSGSDSDSTPTTTRGKRGRGRGRGRGRWAKYYAEKEAAALAAAGSSAQGAAGESTGSGSPPSNNGVAPMSTD